MNVLTTQISDVMRASGIPGSEGSLRHGDGHIARREAALGHTRINVVLEWTSRGDVVSL